jgi:nitrite reductase/ring-hydroxylating ferredoxin subunit
MNRRAVLKTVLVSGVSLLFLDDTLLGLTKRARPFLTSTLKLSLTDPRFSALNAVNGTVEITDAMAPGLQTALPGGYPLALVRVSQTQISALSKRCAHQGCEVGAYNGTKFICPCHGSQYNADGSRISGPTPGPLPSYPAALAGSIVTISELPGNSAWNLTAADDSEAPTSFALLSNQPNPFAGRTQISYMLGLETTVQLSVYNSAGKQLRELVNARQSPGSHSVIFDAGNLEAGTYFYTLRAGRFVESKKMTILK